MPPLKFPYWIITDAHSAVQGVLMISSTGLVLHCLPHASAAAFENDAILSEQVRKLLSSHALYCIMGSREGTEIVQKLYGKTVRCRREYELLVYSGTEYGGFEEISGSLSIKHCTEKDCGALLPLQIEYDKVEVVPDGDSLNTAVCRQNLTRLLKTQEIYSIITNSEFCAKAGTNAHGYNWVQIGGVYTDVKYRNKGFARLLVSYVAHSFHARGKKVCLFVRTSNISAKKAYFKAGFIFDSLYSIVYY